MKIEIKPIDSIKPYQGNPRINTDAIPAVAKSIQEFGFRVPILVDSDNVIIAGHTRLNAAKSLNLSEVPVVTVTDLTPEQIKALRIADNKTASLSYWDEGKLCLELSALRDSDFDLMKLGFSSQEIEDFLNSNDDDAESDEQIDEDEIPETPIEVVSKRGEIYTLGRHRLLCGDSTNINEIKLLVADNMVDLLACDPPYAVGYVGKTKDALTIANDALPPEEFLRFLTAAFKAADIVMKPGASLYIWHADSTASAFYVAAKAVGWQILQRLVWVKDAFILSRQDYHWRHELALFGQKTGAEMPWFADEIKTSILQFNRPNRNAEHPTMKPVELFKDHLRTSCPPGGVVLDLFGGSGTTMIAVEQLGMTACLAEILPQYCDVIRKRWAEFVHGEGCDWVSQTPPQTE